LKNDNHKYNLFVLFLLSSRNANLEVFLLIFFIWQSEINKDLIYCLYFPMQYLFLTGV